MSTVSQVGVTFQPSLDSTIPITASFSDSIGSNSELPGRERVHYIEDGEPTLAHARALLANRRVIIATDGPGWIVVMIICWCTLLTKVGIRISQHPNTTDFPNSGPPAFQLIPALFHSH
ncbi:hypothetical protein CPB83DRAFT_899170 [Crepidotus variabilis]|uniref:Uncharacterized protein n=1 Tax=Crepidotus variabilis TaxID=179855 RepID=A0A9P6JJE8_9AGAR|nr:hypothetical protein CPB83DRAFT_899170 [Crepidotus variabilis]